MNGTIPAIYEQGVLRPLVPLHLPEHTHVQIQIVALSPDADEERQRVRRVLLDAGIIRPRSPVEQVQAVPEDCVATAAEALAVAGPLSELIIAERDGR